MRLLIRSNGHSELRWCGTVRVVNNDISCKFIESVIYHLRSWMSCCMGSHRHFPMFWLQYQRTWVLEKILLLGTSSFCPKHSFGCWFRYPHQHKSLDLRRTEAVARSIIMLGTSIMIITNRSEALGEIRWCEATVFTALAHRTMFLYFIQSMICRLRTIGSRCTGSYRYFSMIWHWYQQTWALEPVRLMRLCSSGTKPFFKGWLRNPPQHKSLNFRAIESVAR